MYAFGHIMLTLFVLYKLTKDLKKAFILAPLTLIPDIDLILGIEHRGVLHSILILPLFFLSLFFVNKIFRLNLNKKEIITFSFLLYFLHIFADAICGHVMIFPGIYIGTSCRVDAIKDLVFGFIFYLLFLLELFSKKLSF